jgi:hypothetical protein
MTCDIVGRVSIGASWKKLHHLIAPEGQVLELLERAGLIAKYRGILAA